ncbi:deoxyribonuclease-4 [Mumia flava]|uniref:Deoxyribonuclease-4 n=1 Tax=Mumia flava TaxID=1348852 RepID=A0A0B2BPL1_9ACTN|nr:deoxyribonuclease IV [Mumia flava]PJJ57109.1 deoxyribonuclease-4 [Mumia flava]
MSTVRIGTHVSSDDPFTDAERVGADVVQIFLGDPQSWKWPKYTFPGGAEGLRDGFAERDLPVYVHAPYPINVASMNNRVRIPSRKLIQNAVDGAAEIGASGVVVHGGYVDAEADLERGFDSWRKCVDAIDAKVPVLLENTAGGDWSMARRLDRIARTWEAIQAGDGAEGWGFCLDTCHAWAGGIALEDVVEKVTAITGRIDLVHCNNSRDAFDSGADRHTHLTSGEIPAQVLADVVGAAGAPVICETHGDAVVDDIAWLRSEVS